MTSDQPTLRPWYKRILRLFLRILLGLFIFIILLVLFVRSPWGQDIITDKVTNYVSDKIDTKFEIDKLYVTFTGNITLEKLYLEDKSQDTLLYSKYLEANVPFRPLIFGNEIKIDLVDWRGFKTNISRKDTLKGFNFQYIIDAFTSSDEDTAQSKELQENSENSINISLGHLSFLDFDLTYTDEVMGIDSELILGSLEAESESIDLQNMKFHIAEINLNETSITFSQTKPTLPSEDEKTAALPWILVDELSIQNVDINYNALPDGITSETYIDDFSFSGLDANLDKQNVVLKQLVWKDSKVKLELKSTLTQDKETTEVADTSKPFSWPQWQVTIDEIDLQNQNIEFYQNGKRPLKDEFSAEAIAIEDLDFGIANLELSIDEKLSFDLNRFQFKEKSGLVLKEFQVETTLNSKQTKLNNLRFQMNNSAFFADLKLNYRSLDELINSPKNSTVNLNVNSLKIDVKDAYMFSPDLKTNEQFQNLALHNFKGNFKAVGNLEKLDIPNFEMRWGTDTQLQLKANVSHVTDVDKLGFDLSQLVAKTNKQNISAFVSEKDLGISIPQTLTISGDFKKNGNDFSTQSTFETPYGNIALEGFYNSTNFIDYGLGIDVIDLKLGKLLQNEQLGALSMQLSSNGKGKTLNTLTAQLSSKIDSLRFDNYSFSGLHIKGDLEEGKGDMTSNYSDDNLKFDFTTNIQLDSISPKIDLVFDLKGIRTQAFGLTSKDLRAQILTKIQFEGNVDKFQLDAQLKDGLVVYDDNPYHIGDIELSSKVDSTQSIAEISSRFLNGNFNANTDIEGVSKAIQNHFKTYQSDSLPKANSKSPVNFDMELKLIDSPILSEVLLEGFKEMDTLQASVRFNEDKNSLISKLKLPYLNYKDNEIKKLNFEINSTGNIADFNFGFDKVIAGPLNVAKTQIQGKFEDRQLNLNLEAYQDDKEFYSSTINVKFEDDNLYRLHVASNKLILNGLPWTIPDDNEITYKKDELKVSNFILQRQSQEIKFSEELDFDKDHLGIGFKNFTLSTLMRYFNPNDKLAGGKLNGRILIIEPFFTNGFVSNLNIENLSVLEVPLGNLALTAKANSSEDYKIDLSLRDEGIILTADGNYHSNLKETDLQLNIDIEEVEMQTIESFATNYLKDSDGHLRGNFTINGPIENLDYRGHLSFDDVHFNLKTLNTLFHLKNEKIEMAKAQISFNNFTIADEQGNIFTTDGSVDIGELTNPGFDLTFEAKDFQLLNSTAKDNELYFGKMVFDASAKLEGDLIMPDLDLNLTIKDETELTYIVQESQASIEEREGVVVFVNKSNPNDILTQTDDEDLNAVITGIDLKSDISIQKQSKVKVVFNKRTQDNVTIQGGGDFKFDISRTGKMNLIGQYNVTDGSVELNLYNLVKRRFDISSSSSVTWSGDPYNANLNLRAVYKIETSASSLMASQTAGESALIQNRYKQKLPFFVYLDVNGELMSPDLSFKLDMPEDKQGAINGSVYGRISQINQQDDELNKQVFSLLVLNRFYPESSSDGSQGGASALARDNINQALSDQLNAFSDKLTGNMGINLNFDVNSYTDYQGSSNQDRTDVNVTAKKSLMNDRLVVEAGGQMNVEGEQRPGESQGVVGNVSVEYLLTEDGRWKLRAFRKSEYENVIDGQVFVSGIALIFTREFNKFKVLWDKAYRESLKKEKLEDNKALDYQLNPKKKDKQKPKAKTDG